MPASGAVAVHLQLVALDLIMVSLGQLLLQVLQGRFLKLLDLAATQAAQMIMQGLAVNVLVMPVAVAKIDFPDEAAIHEQGQRPVDGGLGDLGALALKQQIEFVHVKVAVPGKDLAENLFALGSAPQPPPADIILKDLEFGIHGPNRNVIEN